ncbi:hypothetical protein DSO57_1022408 [Entomophthora muscae]|uniref:Uncharacterized protein n=1 Tax=Entomophthora muscae TaxID=34485 RepID=A0ACC2RHZ1_9FUNG|nr:hypothetical protein DSO57_1022408 [Entomophthora muscae]
MPRNINPFCLLSPPYNWPLVYAKAYYYDASNDECVEHSAGLLSGCAAFATYNECKYKCLTPAFVPGDHVPNNVASGFETSQHFLQCRPQAKADCRLLLGGNHVCVCQERSTNDTNYIDPYTSKI